MPIRKICPICKESFEVRPSQERRRKCCSLECRGKMYSGEKHPNFGKKNPALAERMRQHSGEKSYRYGKKHTQITKDKISQSCLEKPKTQKHRDNISKATKGKKLGRKNHKWKEKIQKICPICKEVFNITPSRKNQKSCSIECKAKLQSETVRGENHPFYGKKRPDHAEFMRGRMTGENHPGWMDGISFEPYTMQFNKQLKATIRHRDGYKCQKCECPEIENNQKLAIHHIDYNKQNCKPFNLISLCKRCNGKVNSNRPYWTKYFTKKIKKIMTSSVLQLHFNYTIGEKEKTLK